jgi:hypothetical protein
MQNLMPLVGGKPRTAADFQIAKKENKRAEIADRLRRKPLPGTWIDQCAHPIENQYGGGLGGRRGAAASHGRAGGTDNREMDAANAKAVAAENAAVPRGPLPEADQKLSSRSRRHGIASLARQCARSAEIGDMVAGGVA